MKLGSKLVLGGIILNGFMAMVWTYIRALHILPNADCSELVTAHALSSGLGLLALIFVLMAETSPRY